MDDSFEKLGWTIVYALISIAFGWVCVYIVWLVRKKKISFESLCDKYGELFAPFGLPVLFVLYILIHDSVRLLFLAP